MTDDVTAAQDEVIESDDLVEQPEDTATSEDASEDKPDEPEAPKKARRNRRTESQRIAQLTAQVREKERELARMQEASKAPQTDTSKAPKREDYDDYEQYIEARAEYSGLQAAEKRLGEAEKSRKQAESQAQEDNQARAFQDARDNTVDRGCEVYDDFEEVTASEDLHITPVMADALLSSDRGHDVWYHLGKNPEKAEQIAAMHPVQQIMALGRIEANLAGGKTASGAPPPTKPVSQRGSSSNVLSDKLSTAEWMKRRAEEVRKSTS